MTEHLTDFERAELMAWWNSDWPDDGSDVIDTLAATVEAIVRCRLAAAEIKLRAARLALKACADVREAKGLRLGSCCIKVGTEECVCETPTNWGLNA